MPDFTDFYPLENLDFTFGSIIVFLPPGDKLQRNIQSGVRPDGKEREK